jgi:hypothetical protein
MKIEDYILASVKPVHPTHLAERFSVSKSKAYNTCVSLLLEGKVEEVRVGARATNRREGAKKHLGVCSKNG